MLTFDETTLERAAAVYGPFRLEHGFLQDYARLNRAAGELAVRLVDLLERQPVDPCQINDALIKTEVAMVDLYVALEQLQALLGFHPDGNASPFFALHTARMDDLEKSVRKAEQARAARYGCPARQPDAYDKHEVLDMICTLAAREAAAKEKEEPHGTV